MHREGNQEKKVSNKMKGERENFKIYLSQGKVKIAGNGKKRYSSCWRFKQSFKINNYHQSAWNLPPFVFNGSRKALNSFFCYFCDFPWLTLRWSEKSLPPRKKAYLLLFLFFPSFTSLMIPTSSPPPPLSLPPLFHIVHGLKKPTLQKVYCVSEASVWFLLN